MAKERGMRIADSGQLQKDYLMRKARQEQALAAGLAETTDSLIANSPAGTVPTPLGSSSRYSFLPKRSATLGSIKDSTGGEVIGDRVILYIHGACPVDDRIKERSDRIRRSFLLLLARHS